MLNRIIRLQAVIKIITNLELPAKQKTQMWAVIYQNLLVLDYLLAEGGRVCGKFNGSDCYLHIGDNGQAVMEIATNVRKMTHVPV
jgi:hypothetical protein